MGARSAQPGGVRGSAREVVREYVRETEAASDGRLVSSVIVSGVLFDRYVAEFEAEGLRNGSPPITEVPAAINWDGFWVRPKGSLQ